MESPAFEEALQLIKDDLKLRRDIDALLNWGIKEGFIGDEILDWPYHKKLDFYRRCP